ncbi:MAG: MFS transporter, partial [Planctomycetes bacterium]|nr:MFS transporter [Planctomycetota bacterium]
MWPSRWKLVSLWFSQTARVTADNALRFFVCLDFATGDAQKNSAWYLVNVIFTLPAILLAPFNGAICNSLPKSLVLHATALYGFAVMGSFLLLNDYWIACWSLIAVGSAIYGPTRYAMLPAAAVDTRWPLTRINAFIEMGTFSAILGGLILIVGTDLGTTFAAVAVIAALNGVAWLTAAPVAFPSDLRRDEPAWAAVRDFFVDFKRIWNIREARISLIGLSGKRGLVIGMSGAMIAILFRNEVMNLEVIAHITCWVAGGVAVGSLLAGLQKHPRRVLGLVPIGGLGFTLGLMYAADTMVAAVADSQINVWFCAVVGMAAGLINVPLASTYQAAVPDDARGNAMAVRNMMDYVCFAVVGATLGILGRYAGFDGTMQLWLVSAIAGVATLAAWWIFRREVWEQVIEFVFAIMYRFRAAGPGLDKFPIKGPVIVVANHSSWIDPIWL